ncbi:hypothetical protein AURDEDRAFT_185712 [Auricularia subglabra TFB-10046 SS5]|nr:hypothetical protein AURDEDRAFT_185712 [Auricularia subglabra TFB-10046 SS5]
MEHEFFGSDDDELVLTTTGSSTPTFQSPSGITTNMAPTSPTTTSPTTPIPPTSTCTTLSLLLRRCPDPRQCSNPSARAPSTRPERLSTPRPSRRHAAGPAATQAQVIDDWVPSLRAAPLPVDAHAPPPIAVERNPVIVPDVEPAHARISSPRTSAHTAPLVSPARLEEAQVRLPGGVGDVKYYDLAVERLVLDFPYVPKQWVRRTLAAQGGLYAPAYILLHQTEHEPDHVRGYSKKKTPTARGKGREVNYDDLELELAKEIKFIQEWRDAANPGQAAARTQEEEEPGSEELAVDQGSVECGCCFGEYKFTPLQCPDAHLFCIACVRAYAGTKLEEGTPDIKCPSTSDPPCGSIFDQRVLRKALSEKAKELYYWVKTRRELEAAGLDNLEECPFLDNADEKLFRCAREGWSA